MLFRSDHRRRPGLVVLEELGDVGHAGRLTVRVEAHVHVILVVRVRHDDAARAVQPRRVPDEDDRRARGDEAVEQILRQLPVDLLGRAVPAVQTKGGLRAPSKETPIEPESVERYLAGKLGASLEDATAIMRKLAMSLPPDAVTPGPGTFVDARVTHSAEYDLAAELVT